MVQLIPDVLSPEIKSPAEKRLFVEFRDHRTNKKYIVLHSLGIAEHANKIFGEIDFVILCNEGVLCLEVKGGQVMHGAYAVQMIQGIVYLLALFADKGLYKTTIIILTDHGGDIALQLAHLSRRP